MSQLFYGRLPVERLKYVTTVAWTLDAIMKITEVQATPIHIEVKCAVQIADRRVRVPLSWDLYGDKVLVRISTDEDLVEWGAVSLVPREWGVTAQVVAHYINRYYAPILIDHDPFDIELILSKMDDLFEFRLIP